MLNGLVIYNNVNTAVACALALVAGKWFVKFLDDGIVHCAQQSLVLALVGQLLPLNEAPEIFDTSFFVPELRKLADIFDVARATPASGLAHRASTLLEALIARAEQSSLVGERPAKRQSGISSKVTSIPPQDDTLKHKVCG